MFKKISIAAIASYAVLSLALPAMAQTVGTTTGATTPPAGEKKEEKKVDLACMQNAVVKRDGAVIAAFDAYHAAAKAALTVRQSALKAAWGNSDAKARREAIRAAWKDYREAVRKARKDFHDAKREAWKQFMQDRRTCHGSGEGDEGEGVDSQL